MAGRLVLPKELWMAAPYAAMAVGWLWLRHPWITVALFHGGMALALGTNRGQWSPRRLALGLHAGWLAIALLSTALFGWWLYHRQDRYCPALLEHGASFGLAGPEVIFLAIYFCLANPLLEEAFWRGLFSSRRAFSLLPDLAYGGFHYLIFCPFVAWQDALMAALALAAAGSGWRLISHRLGGLAIPILWHGFGDFIVILVPYQAVYGGE